MTDEFKTTDVEELRSALMSVDEEVMSSTLFPELIPLAARAIRKYAVGFFFFINFTRTRFVVIVASLRLAGSKE